MPWILVSCRYSSVITQMKTHTCRHTASAAAAKSLQSCPTLCDPIDGSPPGSTVPGVLQASTLEWVAISFSNAWKWKVKVNSLSRVWLLATPWTATHQAPPSMGFSRQEYWSGVPLPSLLQTHACTQLIFMEHLICARYFLGAGLDSGSESINRFMCKSGDDNYKGLKHDKDKSTTLYSVVGKVSLIVWHVNRELDEGRKGVVQKSGERMLQQREQQVQRLETEV